MGPISGGEFIVLIILAAIVLGPERLPQYAQQLGRLVRELRRMAQGATAQVRNEMGPEFEDIDWKKLDPRQYDPRKIVREALADDDWDDDDPFGFKGLAQDVEAVVNDDPAASGSNGSTSRTRSTSGVSSSGPGAGNVSSNGSSNGYSNGATGAEAGIAEGITDDIT